MSLLKINNKPAVAEKTVADMAEDTITSIRFSPTAGYMAATSWDAKCRIYDVDNDLNARPVTLIKAEAPLFSCDWSKVGH